MAAAFVSLRDTITITVALMGLYWFASSFFLAKQSLPSVSHCNESSELLQLLGLSDAEIQHLVHQGIVSNSTETTRNGCWMDRKVDSVVLLVVDALRFDFCLYNLPNSVGARLHGLRNSSSSSRLFRFVADPPTVTMQRLKALTTGGLPTFADISANFGGATVDDDSWLAQWQRCEWQSRGMYHPPRSGFVGDDTWVDLFPNVFTESYPYPSFNTRDLDTVDNGCLLHLPNLMQQVVQDNFEVVVVHFLGVDHVGHTYGPHDEHMDAKLKQMDHALSTVLQDLDDSHHCHAVFIMGDHGMTDDGNHGGGTEEEISAALFVHVSQACGDLGWKGTDLEYEATWVSPWSQTRFASIHQIDLVPTLSILLGLPIPFANLGSLVPSLLPVHTSAQVATAMALNAAQVWRYLKQYSERANRLPNLDNLEQYWQSGVSLFRQAISDGNDDRFDEAAQLFKLFLAHALDLGQRVWTRFDTIGMTGGILVLGLAVIVYAIPLVRDETSLRQGFAWDVWLAVVFMIYQCGLLTFSNSYILEEQASIMFCLAILSLAVTLSLNSDRRCAIWQAPFVVPVASRVHESLISGHGLDPSIRLHLAHTVGVFSASILILLVVRWSLYRYNVIRSLSHAVSDCLALLCLGESWWEKRSPDLSWNGFVACRMAFMILIVSLAMLQVLGQKTTTRQSATLDVNMSFPLAILAKLLLLIAVVTGPATGTTLVLYTLQLAVMYYLSSASSTKVVGNIVIAALCKLATRHVFFATNHGCAFSRLQYSAAFVATTEFYYVMGGMSLFLNTFGWEIVGLAFAWTLSRHPERSGVWRAYSTFQLLEALTSCISVSLLRRHLMVWDIYAPHFLFAAIFTALNGVFHLLAALLQCL